MSERSLYPRPEYPRPDFQRGVIDGEDWLNLNGAWQFRFDPERHGEEQKWFQPDNVEWREQIIVPFCWESLAAWGEADSAGNDNYYSTRVFLNPLEVTRENHRSARRFEVGWYRRQIVIPEGPAWKHKRVILHIGAADFFTDCWCNGIHLGRHEGGYVPFEFDLTDALVNEDGRQQALIVIRVEDPINNAEQPVGKQWRWYTTTSGIWQTVFIEPRDETHIESVRIVSDIDARTAYFRVRCAGTNGQDKLSIVVSPRHTEPAEIQFRDGVAEATLQLSAVELWDPNRPFLYKVRLEIRRKGETVDAISSYFGMRKIDYELTRESGVAALRLNGVARYLRGALYQSYHPDGVYTATSVDVLKDDIVWAKRFGFNFLRVHIKIDDPMLLYYADKMGILLMADFPNFGEGGDTPLGRSRFETMMRQGIERDANHPSIIAWCLFNETWGFGGQNTLAEHLLAPPPAKGLPPGESRTPVERSRAAGMKPGMTSPQLWVQEMWELAKQLDPTRLVEDMSVCMWEHLEYYQHCDTDVNSWHFYISDYTKAKEHIDKIVHSTFIGSSFNYVPGFVHKGQPLINSEYGGVGALDGDRDISWSFKFLTNELRRHPQISAYIYTELHDVEWEYNGFLNYDRTPKEFGYNPRIINESNTLPVDAPPVQKVSPGLVVTIPVASSHYSTAKHEQVWLQWSLAGVDTRGRLNQDIARGRVKIPFPHLAVAHAHTVELTMPSVPMLCTLLLTAHGPDGQTIAENFLHFYVSDSYPAEREDTPRALILRGTPATWGSAEWSGGSGEREKERAEDACYGFGHGYFEWQLPLGGADLSKARRIRLLCEASSHRSDWPQTDEDFFPTTLEMHLNGVRLHRAMLRNHPHDSRGVLSYWRGGVGAYGYLAHAVAEGEAVRQILANGKSDTVSLRFGVPSDALAQGGLTIYGAECGRYPVSPTVIIEW